jgi:opacity protein-like surface antigen
MITFSGKQGLRLVLALAAAAATFVPAAAEAQITRVSSSDARNQVVFNIGYFAVRGEDSRTEGDVLVTDLEGLLFDIKDFNGATFGAEYLFGLGEYLEGGVGAGFYQRTVPSIYREFTHDDGSEIEQDLKLRIAPFSATIRFLPLGRTRGIEPYVGAGIAVFNWRFSETGEFFDAFDNSIFRDNYVADGNAVGPVILAGVRGPVADTFTIGGELRYQRAEGDTDPETSRMLNDKIDLGGWSANLTFGFRF